MRGKLTHNSSAAHFPFEHRIKTGCCLGISSLGRLQVLKWPFRAEQDIVNKKFCAYEHTLASYLKLWNPHDQESWCIIVAKYVIQEIHNSHSASAENLLDGLGQDAFFSLTSAV